MDVRLSPIAENKKTDVEGALERCEVHGGAAVGCVLIEDVSLCNRGVMHEFE